MLASYTKNRRILATPIHPARSGSLMAVAFTALLGLVVVWGVGFSPIEALHNAAHDVRHSNGFPCH